MTTSFPQSPQSQMPLAVPQAAVPQEHRHVEIKASTAFRTISEVATNLEVPQHVLRFWESKFPQIRPLKRGGGRRYYRPEDVALISNIKELLYTQGMTIRGVQKLLREGNRPQFSRTPGTVVAAIPTTMAINTPSSGVVSRALPSDKRREMETVLGELKAMREFLHQVGV